MAGGAGTAAVRKARQNGIAVVCGVGGGLVLRPVAWRSIPGNSQIVYSLLRMGRTPGHPARDRAGARRRRGRGATRSGSLHAWSGARALAGGGRAPPATCRQPPRAPTSCRLPSPLPCPVSPSDPLASCACQFLDVRKTAFKLNSRNAECFCHDGHDDATPTEELYVGTTAGYAVAD